MVFEFLLLLYLCFPFLLFSLKTCIIQMMNFNVFLILLLLQAIGQTKSIKKKSHNKLKLFDEAILWYLFVKASTVTDSLESSSHGGEGYSSLLRQ